MTRIFVCCHARQLLTLTKDVTTTTAKVMKASPTAERTPITSPQASHPTMTEDLRAVSRTRSSKGIWHAQQAAAWRLTSKDVSQQALDAQPCGRANKLWSRNHYQGNRCPESPLVDIIVRLHEMQDASLQCIHISETLALLLMGAPQSRHTVLPSDPP